MKINITMGEENLDHPVPAQSRGGSGEEAGRKGGGRIFEFGWSPKSTPWMAPLAGGIRPFTVVWPLTWMRCKTREGRAHGLWKMGV
jgi:hypothetical protein